jgi:thioredoxin 1
VLGFGTFKWIKWKESEMSEFVAEVTDTNWENEVIKADRPVLVDFWAAWCGPCRLLAPTVEAVAEKYQGKAKIVKLNVDENIESPAKYGIRGIPTLILFHNGQEVDRHVGVPANAKDAISQMIERRLA